MVCGSYRIFIFTHKHHSDSLLTLSNISLLSFCNSMKLTIKYIDEYIISKQRNIEALIFISNFPNKDTVYSNFAMY